MEAVSAEGSARHTLPVSGAAWACGNSSGAAKKELASKMSTKGSAPLLNIGCTAQ